MNLIKYFLALVLVAVLAACGGGGGSGGTPSSGSGSGGSSSPSGTSTVVIATPTVAIASDFVFQLDKQSLSTTGNDRVLLTILAVDSSRNVVANVPVSVVVDNGGVFSRVSPALLTDNAGQFSGNISIGGDKSNRVINAEISISGIRKMASVQVAGSQISITPVPATPAPGGLVTVDLDSSDSAGSPVSGVVITLSGSSGASGNHTTDLAGKKTISFTAPTAPGSYSVVATGLGATTSRVIQVTSPSGGSLPAAIGVPSSVSLSPQPSSISPNPIGTTTNRAKLTARFLTATNSGLENMRVRFEVLQPALGSGEALSTAGSVVYSDRSGLAEVDYIAGARSSPTNGVLLRACYKATDFTSATDCPNSVTTTLTVAGTPLGLSISDNNLLEKGLGDIAYIKKFLIQVNDASGVAVPNAVVSVSVDITHYGKGRFEGVYPLGTTAPNLADPSLGYLAVGTGTSTFVVVPSTSISPGFLRGSDVNAYINVWCANEDTNRNGSLDSGEDVNSNGILEPRKAEVIVSYSSGNTTNASGQMLVQVSYGQNVGRWLAYTLRATTRVGGSEGDASKTYITDVLQGDVSNGSFLTPPYGSGSCSSRN